MLKPANVSFFQYPRFDVSERTAFKSMDVDNMTVLFNRHATAALILSSNEVDKSGDSYYGDSHLNFISMNGQTQISVPLLKDGPIYDVQWNPMHNEFIVVHGYMPSKAVAYSSKAEPLFEFGTEARNTVRYNPQGNFICIAGFGNVPGFMDFWERKKSTFVCLGHAEAPGSSFHDWSPCGREFLTAVAAPRMRVDNRIQLWKYNGELLSSREYEKPDELYEVNWRPIDVSMFPERPASPNAIQKNSVEVKEESKASVYIPPWARGKEDQFLAAFKTSEVSGPRKLDKNITASSSSSSSVSSNSRILRPQVSVSSVPPGYDSDDEKKGRRRRQRGKNKEKSSDESDVLESTSASASSSNSSSVDDTEKKVKALKKKLGEIEKLKARFTNGDKLNHSQIQKMESEADVRFELCKFEKMLHVQSQ